MSGPDTRTVRVHNSIHSYSRPRDATWHLKSALELQCVGSSYLVRACANLELCDTTLEPTDAIWEGRRGAGNRRFASIPRHSPSVFCEKLELAGVGEVQF